MNKTKLIIWDFNGTLVDDTWLFVEIINILLEKNGLKKISITDYQSVFCFPIKKYYELLGFDFKRTDFDSLSHEFIKLYNKRKYSASLYSGASSLLEKLSARKVDMCLLSAQEHSSLVDLSKYYNIHSCFKFVQGTDNINAEAKSILAKKIISSFNYEPEELLFIGDTNMDVDIALENNSNVIILTCGHQASYRFTSSPCVFKINSFDRLGPCLRAKFLGCL